MALDHTTQERIQGLADGSIAPASGMEIHFVSVCKGKAEPCSIEEREWFSFLQSTRQQLEQREKEAQIPYEYGLPGMAELDDLVRSGVNIASFETLTQAIGVLSEIRKKKKRLQERARSLEHRLETGAKKAVEIGADHIFRDRIQKEKTDLEDVLNQWQAKEEQAYSDLTSAKECQRDIDDKIDALYKLDPQLLEQLEASDSEEEKQGIKKERAKIRKEYEDAVAQIPELRNQIEELEKRISSCQLKVAQFKEEVSDLDREKPEERDRLAAYEIYMRENGNELSQIREEIKIVQEEYNKTEKKARSIFARLQPDLIAEKAKMSMTPGRRQTFFGPQSVSGWGKYRSNWLDFQETLSEFKIEKLFHFTDTRNLILILELGGLFSWKALETKGITIPAPGGDSLSRDLDERNNLENYVRLSFSRTHPMLTKAKSEGRIQREFVIEISPDVIFFNDTKFSNKNAASNRRSFNLGNSLGAFRTIRFDVFAQSYWDEETKPFFQAEILVPQHIPREFILNWQVMEKLQ